MSGVQKRMKNNKIKQMADKLLPEDLRSILLSVNSDVKWAILSDLSDGDKSFTQLKEDLEIDDKSLANNLDKLLVNGIITHYYKHEFFKPNYSFYELTNIGKNMIKSLDYIFYFPNPKEYLRKDNTNRDI
jgi:DNA-binding HxlR family transcriptional regulator